MNELDDAQKIDFNMGLKSKGLNRLVTHLFDGIPNKQKQGTYRQYLRDSLRIILINLISTDGYISYKRDKRAAEYRVKKYSAKNVCKVVDFLSSNEFIESRRGYFFEQDGTCKTSKIRCLKKLRGMFDNYQVKQREIQLKPQTDLIILRDNAKQSIPFKDTDFTLSARANLKKVNGLLYRHSIILPDGRPLIHKAMHRVFNTDFQHGGRFYGPEWQSLNENERAQLVVDNSPMVELDFQSLHPTMLYALANEQLVEDPYSLAGYSPDVRRFLKIVMLVLINTGDEARARKTIQGMINAKKLKMPSEIADLKTLMRDFLHKHEPIINLFSAETGLRLQRQDSDICDHILTYFSENDIPILGVHDSYIVGVEHEEKLRKTMKEVFYNKFKAICCVSKKGQKKV